MCARNRNGGNERKERERERKIGKSYLDVYTLYSVYSRVRSYLLLYYLHVCPKLALLTTRTHEEERRTRTYAYVRKCERKCICQRGGSVRSSVSSSTVIVLCSTAALASLNLQRVGKNSRNCTFFLYLNTLFVQTGAKLQGVMYHARVLGQGA